MSQAVAYPVMVQCWRPGQFTTWFTDKAFPDLESALAHAHQMHDQWGRRVRVIDQNEVVYLRIPNHRRIVRG